MEKIKEKGNVKYPLTKAISCFDPTVITASKTTSIKRFKSLCNILIDTGRITATNTDKVFIDRKCLMENSLFMVTVEEFSSKRQDSEDSSKLKRLDDLCRDTVGNHPQYEYIYRVIKIIIIVLPGNTEVERGFSTNKYLLLENIQEKSLSAHRLVHLAI